MENPESHSSGKKMTSIYLYVESIDDALDRVSKEGGKRVSEKMSESEHGCYALFEDTEGNVHGVYTWQG